MKAKAKTLINQHSKRDLDQVGAWMVTLIRYKCAVDTSYIISFYYTVPKEEGDGTETKVIKKLIPAKNDKSAKIIGRYHSMELTMRFHEDLRGPNVAQNL